MLLYNWLIYVFLQYIQYKPATTWPGHTSNAQKRISQACTQKNQISVCLSVLSKSVAEWI